MIDLISTHGVNRECPACSSTTWRKVGEQHFNRVDDSDPYLKSRIDFMFNYWYLQDTLVTISWVICEGCGFVAFSPRPEEADIQIKYQTLTKESTLSRTPKDALPFDEKKWDAADASGAHRARAADLYRTVTPAVASTHCRVLDFGGSSGHLMRNFLANGMDCDVIDYSVRRPLPGLGYKGAEVSDLSEYELYDLIICSHVFEHLANPIAIAEALRKHLTPNGLLYIEVPVEIWRGPPKPRELVTHTNYFSATSVEAMIKMSGGRVVACHYAPYITYGAKKGLAVKALCVKGESDFPLSGGSHAKGMLAGDIKALLTYWMPGSFGAR